MPPTGARSANVNAHPDSEHARVEPQSCTGGIAPVLPGWRQRRTRLTVNRRPSMIKAALSRVGRCPSWLSANAECRGLRCGNRRSSEPAGLRWRNATSTAASSASTTRRAKSARHIWAPVQVRRRRERCPGSAPGSVRHGATRGHPHSRHYAVRPLPTVGGVLSSRQASCSRPGGAEKWRGDFAEKTPRYLLPNP